MTKPTFRSFSMPCTVKAAAFFMVLLLLHGCSDDKNSKTVQITRSLKAQVMEVERSALPEIRSFSGRVRAKVSVALAAKMPGNVKRVEVEIGDPVKKGDLLILVDDTDVRARIEALKSSRQAVQKKLDAISAKYQYAKINYERFKRLFAQEAATKDELDRTRTEFQALKGQVEAVRAELAMIDAQLSEARNQLDYMAIRSPIDGWVSARSVDVGTYVNPGIPIVSVDSSSDGFWFEADVDESIGLQLRPGLKVGVSVPAAAIDVMVPVAHVRPSSSRATHTITLLADLDKYPVKSGLFGRVSIPVGTALEIVLPAKAVIDRGGIKGVYVLDENRIAKWRIIKIGKRWRKDGDLLVPIASEGQGVDGEVVVSVVSGLAPGEKVVISQLSEVREGIRIE
jgi:RND family efflux transporter MFP subunit